MPLFPPLGSFMLPVQFESVSFGALVRVSAAVGPWFRDSMPESTVVDDDGVAPGHQTIWFQTFPPLNSSIEPPPHRARPPPLLPPPTDSRNPLLFKIDGTAFEVLNIFIISHF